QGPTWRHLDRVAEFHIRIGVRTVTIKVVGKPPYAGDAPEQQTVVGIPAVVDGLRHTVDHGYAGFSQGNGVEIPHLDLMARLVRPEEEPWAEFQRQTIA